MKGIYICLPNEIQRVPANKKPPCIRDRSQSSYKTMNKTIGYCSKTTGCTQKSGFLCAETCCDNHLTKTFQIIINMTKTFQMLIARKSYSIILKCKRKHARRLHELCVENVGKRDIRCHDKYEAMYYYKVGSFSVSCKLSKICLWEEKLSLCRAFVVCLTLMC